MKLTFTLKMLSATCFFSASALSLAEDRVVLTNDFSRDELAVYAQSLEGGKRAFPRKFNFPDHVKAGKVFGIDVSHYQGKIDWTKVSGQGVSFAYIKATQGSNSYDDFFERNWVAVGKLPDGVSPLRRGAYHFMTAKDSAGAQAQNYLKAVGKLNPKDLPPCVDIEWDFLRKNNKVVLDEHGNKIDQWASLSSSEIVSKVHSWLDEVESKTGKRPIIYTNASWWNTRIGEGSGLEDYKVWIADYSSKSLGRESPVTPKKFTWLFWQMTDRGTIKAADMNKGVDTTVLNEINDGLLSGLK